MPARRCPLCPAGSESIIASDMTVCTACRIDVSKYHQENPDLVAAYVTAGIDHLERWLPTAPRKGKKKRR